MDERKEKSFPEISHHLLDEMLRDRKNEQINQHEERLLEEYYSVQLINENKKHHEERGENFL
jgi:hypothetical protein